MIGYCGFCENLSDTDPDKIYHDNEWGIPVHDDRKMFEYITLEVMQCGLNWSLMLKKREIFRKCFDDFDFYKIAEYSENDIQRIMNTPDMIRSERKIEAVINNAKCAVNICNEYGSLCAYFWNFSENKTIIYNGHNSEYFPVSNALSDKISKDMKKREFKYVGTITMYSHLQACGIINDHDENCPCYQKIIKNYPVIFKRRYGEKR